MSCYKNLIVFYFSGTGNAQKAAEWIVQIADSMNITTNLVNITDFEFNMLKDINSKTLIGFCSPTHGFNLPPIMLKFIYNFPNVKNADFFILNTRAGMKLHKIFLPGISGIAQILPVIYWKLKGYKVVGMQPMDLPSNWISLHPGLKEKVVMSIFKRCEKKTKNFAKKILSGQKSCKALISLPVDLIVSPVALGYYFIGRFAIAKTFIASDLCNNCGLCIKNCPVNAIEQINGRMYWTFKCESCMKCMNNCPKRAIETVHGYTFFIWWLIISVLPSFVIGKIVDNELFNVSENPFIIDIIYNSFITFIAIFNVYLSYKLLHFLLKYKFFNKIILYTSITKYKFWRRYKAPKIVI
ncbi:MAG: EFR1 family ferrodoxin [Bacteroidales bacterium]|nr:EFR1 family ferrodoxin [Bacteroidales bacterium]MBN2755562.1 EFR1 family ferrodoxin [Bacteroidales bacterium]